MDPVPFAEAQTLRLPLQKYKVTFLPQNITVEVDPQQIPYGRLGRPGSILDAAQSCGQLELEHLCGGACACATCHVKIRQGGATCSPQEPEELDMLEIASYPEPASRLSCQCVPDGTSDLVVEIPPP